MALLAEAKRKVKFGIDPRNTNWSNDDSKIGQRLLEKMGWEKGKGLGAKEDGIKDHIKAAYKSDTRGLGCTPKDADAWIAHQDDFNDLLKQLNSSQEPSDQNKVERPPDGHKRYYGRFARGQVKTLRSTEDLNCIFGKRKSASEPVTPATQSTNNSGDESDGKKHGVTTVKSSSSVQEYFAMKMAALEAKKENALEPFCSLEKDVSESLNDSSAPSAINTARNDDSYKEDEKKLKKKKKKKDRECLDDIVEHSAEHEMANSVGCETRKSSKNKKSKKENIPTTERPLENEKKVPLSYTTVPPAYDKVPMHEVKGAAKLSKKSRKNKGEPSVNVDNTAECVNVFSEEQVGETLQKSKKGNTLTTECSLENEKKMPLSYTTVPPVYDDVPMHEVKAEAKLSKQTRKNNREPAIVENSPEYGNIISEQQVGVLSQNSKKGKAKKKDAQLTNSLSAVCESEDKTSKPDDPLINGVKSFNEYSRVPPVYDEVESYKAPEAETGVKQKKNKKVKGSKNVVENLDDSEKTLSAISSQTVDSSSEKEVMSSAETPVVPPVIDETGQGDCADNFKVQINMNCKDKKKKKDKERSVNIVENVGEPAFEAKQISSNCNGAEDEAPGKKSKPDSKQLKNKKSKKNEESSDCVNIENVALEKEKSVKRVCEILPCSEKETPVVSPEQTDLPKKGKRKSKLTEETASSVHLDEKETVSVCLKKVTKNETSQSLEIKESGSRNKKRKMEAFIDGDQQKKKKTNSEPSIISSNTVAPEEGAKQKRKKTNSDPSNNTTDTVAPEEGGKQKRKKKTNSDPSNNTTDTVAPEEGDKQQRKKTNSDPSNNTTNTVAPEESGKQKRKKTNSDPSINTIDTVAPEEGGKQKRKKTNSDPSNNTTDTVAPEEGGKQKRKKTNSDPSINTTDTVAPEEGDKQQRKKTNSDPSNNTTNTVAPEEGGKQKRKKTNSDPSINTIDTVAPEEGGKQKRKKTNSDPSNNTTDTVAPEEGGKQKRKKKTNSDPSINTTDTVAPEEGDKQQRKKTNSDPSNNTTDTVAPEEGGKQKRKKKTNSDPSINTTDTVAPEEGDKQQRKKTNSGTSIISSNTVAPEEGDKQQRKKTNSGPSIISSNTVAPEEGGKQKRKKTNSDPSINTTDTVAPEGDKQKRKKKTISDPFINKTDTVAPEEGGKQKRKKKTNSDPSITSTNIDAPEEIDKKVKTDRVKNKLNKAKDKNEKKAPSEKSCMFPGSNLGDIVGYAIKKKRKANK